MKKVYFKEKKTFLGDQIRRWNLTLATVAYHNECLSQVEIDQIQEFTMMLKLEGNSAPDACVFSDIGNSISSGDLLISIGVSTFLFNFIFRQDMFTPPVRIEFCTTTFYNNLSPC